MKYQKQICRRKVDYSIKLPSYLPPILRRLYIGRGIRSSSDLERSVKGMLPWQQLNGIEKAINMLYEAFCANIRIIVIGDFDADGATSTALIILCLLAMGYNNIGYLIPNRFKDSYGISPDIVERAYLQGAEMIITVDNGISSHAGINRAKQLGILVLVTDHHLPTKILPDAEVIVNPNLYNCGFPSKNLAGVGVVFYLMLALRVLLYEKKWFSSRGISVPNLAKYLDLVALGTVADVVSFDTNNRILVWQGLSRIRAGQCRPGIIALLEIANCQAKHLMASDLGFTLGARLNAAGRLDDMSIGVSLLLCENFSEAYILASKLNELNKARKKIETKMQIKAIHLCKNLANNNMLPSGLAIYHPEWHQGVIGILASRIKERFHRPVISFAPTEKSGVLKGSGRSIHGIHIYDILNQLNILYPGLIIKFGGHAMAVGLSLEEKKFHEFQYYFNKLINKWIDPSILKEKIISDGPLLPTEMNIEIARILRDSGPWGQGFPEPLFDGCFDLLQQRIVGERHMKVIVKPIKGGPLINGIIFNIDTEIWPNNSVHEVELVYKLNINQFQGNYFLQIIIDSIWPL